MALLVLVWMQWPDGQLRIVACDVGQGDATLLTQGFVQVLVDGGPANGAVLRCLSEHVPFWDRHIEMVVNSHPQADHYGGLVDVFGRYSVGTLLVADTVSVNESFGEWVELVRGNGTEVMEAWQGMMLGVGPMQWRVLWPQDLSEGFAWMSDAVDYDQVLGAQDGLHGAFEDVNEASVVVEMVFGEDMEALFVGDIGMEVEQELVDGGWVRDVEVLKVGHHGSRTSTSDEWLDVVMPEYGLVYSSLSNTYGHPHDQVISRLERRGVQLWRTDEQGTGVLVSDGVNVWVE